MTAGEYQGLVEFLGRRFDAIDRRFDAIDKRFREVFGHFNEVYRRLDPLLLQAFEELLKAPGDLPEVGAEDRPRNDADGGGGG
ncbi:MAG: hypothetical protein AAB016_09785, partial [candidate division NC10 bacterium]